MLDEEPVRSWWHFVELVRARPGRPVNLLVERDGSRIVREVTTDARSVTDAATGEVTQIGVVGVAPAASPIEYRAIPLVEAARMGVAETWAVTGFALGWLADLVTGDLDLTSTGGILSYAATLAQAAAVDSSFLLFLANGAVVTAVSALVVPFPPLPGGHMLLLLLEVAKREPLSIETRLNLTWLGVFCLGTLFLIGQFNDVMHALGAYF